MNIFKKIYNYRELLKTNVKKEIRGRYKNSILGVVWSFLNPLLQLAVYAVIFGALLAGGDPTYHIYICVALIPWTYFTTAITQSAFTIIGNGDIIKKVYFPREILPLSTATSGLVNYFISVPIILIFLLFSGIGFSFNILWLPLIAITQYILTIGIILITSAIDVYVRDAEYIINFIVTMMFYATPVLYSTSLFPEKYRWLLYLNPMTTIINCYRDIFYYKQCPHFLALFGVLVVSIILLIIGVLIFRKLKKGFAEEV